MIAISTRTLWSLSFLLLSLLLVLPAGAAAGVTGDRPAADTDDPDAIELLRRAATAPARASFEGTQYVTAWSSFDAAAGSASVILDVNHQAGGTTSMWRRGDGQLHTGGPADGGWLVTDAGPVDLLVDAYELRIGRSGQVAGRDTDVVQALRADGTRAASLWLDRQTGLLLRREVQDATGRVINASAFVEVRIDHHGCCGIALDGGGEAGSPTVRPISGAMLDHAALDRLRSHGFACPEQLGETLTLYQARHHGDTVQTSYSDGLVSLSVFEQEGRLDPETMQGYQREEMAGGTVWVHAGPPARFVWSSAGHVITVVTDAPRSAVEGALRELPPEAHEENPDGWLARLGRGGKRVVSWLNPFD